jgi:hypothetical protein
MGGDEIWLDGNAIADLLERVLGTDATSALRGCQSCGAFSALGAHRLHRGAGFVLRCPVCSDVAARIAILPDRHVLVLEGVWRLEIA